MNRNVVFGAFTVAVLVVASTSRADVAARRFFALAVAGVISKDPGAYRTTARGENQAPGLPGAALRQPGSPALTPLPPISRSPAR
jgi:hypothetical protein